MMDDPGLAWPYWKFGLKKDDLFTKLHDQYNTFPSSIQDPEAFHHDVYEVSNEASSTHDFHRLLAQRKQQRLRELNDSLESASLEIIANPSLVGTEQWQYALQLFRTKSLDSLVRYFASYLPADHPWRHPDSSSDASSVDSITHSHGSLFDDDDRPAVVHEPFSISTSVNEHLPPSPRSMTMCSDDHAYMLDSFTPARSLSFSESESEHFALQDSRSHLHDDNASHPCEAASPITSVSDISETASFEMLEKEEVEEVVPVETDATHNTDATDEAGQVAAEMEEMETPTPKPEPRGGSFMDAKPSLPHRRHRSVSPSSSHPLAHVDTLSHLDVRRPHRTPRHRRRGCSPTHSHDRRSRPGESAARIQKPSPEPVRPRPRGRRTVAC